QSKLVKYFSRQLSCKKKVALQERNAKLEGFPQLLHWFRIVDIRKEVMEEIAPGQLSLEELLDMTDDQVCATVEKFGANSEECARLNASLSCLRSVHKSGGSLSKQDWTIQWPTTEPGKENSPGCPPEPGQWGRTLLSQSPKLPPKCGQHHCHGSSSHGPLYTHVDRLTVEGHPGLCPPLESGHRSLPPSPRQRHAAHTPPRTPNIVTTMTPPGTPPVRRRNKLKPPGTPPPSSRKLIHLIPGFTALHRSKSHEFQLGHRADEAHTPKSPAETWETPSNTGSVGPSSSPSICWTTLSRGGLGCPGITFQFNSSSELGWLRLEWLLISNPAGLRKSPSSGSGSFPTHFKKEEPWEESWCCSIMGQLLLCWAMTWLPRAGRLSGELWAASHQGDPSLLPAASLHPSHDILLSPYSLLLKHSFSVPCQAQVPQQMHQRGPSMSPADHPPWSQTLPKTNKLNKVSCCTVPDPLTPPLCSHPLQTPFACFLCSAIPAVPYQPDSSSNPSSTTSSTPSSPAPPLPPSATPPSPLHPSPQCPRQQKQFNLPEEMQESEDDFEEMNLSLLSARNFPRKASQTSIFLQEWDIPFEQLEIGELIGKGRFGQVFHGRWHGEVAIRLIDIERDNEDQLKAFKREVMAYRQTRHENVVLFMGACMSPPHLAIITSLCKGRTLYSVVRDAKIVLDVNKTRQIAQEIVKGMGYLHAKGILHKDLKSKNVFYDNGKVVITDFGLFSISGVLQAGRRENKLRIQNGWLCHLAPEIIRQLSPDTEEDKLPFSKHSDVFALGTIWYELHAREWPFKTQPAEAIIWQVGRGMKPNLSQIGMGKEISDILLFCWAYEQEERPSFTKLMDMLEKLPKRNRRLSHPGHFWKSAE
ncbi:KSR2 Kinase, partial [Rhinopomastus cyanomelas]|nr:KSR2 Kinase [Rhinopomastus cyanomelas]